MNEDSSSGRGGSRPPEQKVAFSSAPIVVLVVLAVFVLLTLARSFFFPVLLALLFSFVLSRPVRWLGKRRIPEPLSAAVILMIIVGLGGWAIVELHEPAIEWLRRTPRLMMKIERSAEKVRAPFEEVTKAAEQVEEIAKIESDEQPRVAVEQPSWVSDVAAEAREAAFSLLVTIILIFLMLVFGRDFLRSLVRCFPESEKKKRVVAISRQVGAATGRYLLTIVMINVSLGIVVAIVMKLIGMPNPWLWGILGGVLNFVPYLGASVCTVIIGVASFATFDDPLRVLIAPLLFFLITATEGNFVTPVILGRGLAMNPLIVFLWIFLWGWMWGVAGVLIAVPLLAAIKIVCENIPELAPISILLSRGESATRLSS
ncbi:MAG: AI-2E family transporter [Thermoanaerobaculia bacterium]|nr:AI-2E family transporter [Thermoanaerobaculia bacterium]